MFYFLLQGVELYVKLFSEASDDTVKCNLQTELLSLLSQLSALTQDQEHMVCAELLFVKVAVFLFYQLSDKYSSCSYDICTYKKHILHFYKEEQLTMRQQF